MLIFVYFSSKTLVKIGILIIGKQFSPLQLRIQSFGHEILCYHFLYAPIFGVDSIFRQGDKRIFDAFTLRGRRK